MAQKTVKIKYAEPPGLASFFVDRIIISPSDDAYVIRFYQVNPPVVLSEEDSEALTEVEAICVSKLVATPEKVIHFIEAMGGALKGAEETAPESGK